MPPLPGTVPQGSSAVLPGSSSVGTGLAAPVNTESGSKEASLRPEFRRLLEQRLNGWVGEAGSERRRTVAKQAGPYLDERGGFDLETLPEGTKRELAKLEKASEGIEAIFVRQLLAQMRRISYDGKPKNGMSQFATDTMDQAVADQTSKGRSSIGIAQIVFLDNAQNLVKSAVAAASQARSETKR
ncbi:MAG: hypothetical protein JST30_03600 [Armatimonadetes bacterium]|nr:hypothetical protein [Armatimonadota bacterium]